MFYLIRHQQNRFRHVKRASSKKIKDWGTDLFYNLLCQQTLRIKQSLVKSYSRFKTLRKKNPSVGKYISSYCCCCFAIFGHCFCIIVCFEMQKQSFLKFTCLTLIKRDYNTGAFDVSFKSSYFTEHLRATASGDAMENLL